LADAELSDADRKELAAILEGRHGKVKVIAVEGNGRAVIVKTTNQVAPLLRDEGSPLIVGGKKLAPVLTSGAIGNLKNRATEAAANGKVP